MDPEERDHEERERKGRLMQGESLSELRDELTEEELHAKYNALMEETARPINRDAQMRYVARAQLYLDELARREAVRQGERMEALTRSINRLTFVIAIVTFIGVGRIRRSCGRWSRRSDVCWRHRTASVGASSIDGASWPTSTSPGSWARLDRSSSTTPSGHRPAVADLRHV